MFEMFSGFNANKLKPQLKMAVGRFQIASNKKSALLKQNMRGVALLLAEEPPKEEKARIKAEALIRDDYMIEAYDILSLNCELLGERIKLIAFSKECPPDLVSCISTLIYAAPRVDIPELQEIRKQFRAKYGKKFEEDALNNTGGVLNERVVTKLSVQPPAAYLVQTYLEQICEKYEVNWSPTVPLTAENMGEPMQPPTGYSVQIGQGTGLGPMVATTGTTVVGEEEEITYDGNSPNKLAPFPPQGPTSYVSIGNKSNSTPSKADDFTEPDLFIPAAPGQKGSSASSSSSTGLPPPAPPSAPPADNSMAPSSNNNKRGDDDDDQPAPAGGGQSSYQDLAARFENLKDL